MAAGLLEETKSVLKSLIISSPHGMTIDRLNKDYREWEGKAIPYSDLGYSKLETFLRSLDDTLVVTGSGFNATVTAIASEKSAHIDKMVTKQKSSTRRRSRLKTPQENGKPSPTKISQQDPTHVMHQNWQTSKHTQALHYPLQQATQSLLQHQTNLQNVMLRQQQQIQQTLQQNLMQNAYRYQVPQNAYGYNNLMHHPLLTQTQKPFDNWQNFQYSMQTTPQYFSYDQHQNIPLLKRLNSIDIKPINQTSQVDPNINGTMKVESNKTNRRSQLNQSNTMNDSGKGPSPDLNDTNVNIERYTDSPRKDNSSFESKAVNGNYNGDRTSSTSGSTRNTTDYDQSNNDTILENEAASSRENIDNDPLGDISQDQLFELEQKLSEINISPKPVNRKRKLYKKDVEAVPELQKNDIVFQLDFPIDTVKYGETIPESEIPENLVEASWFGVFIAEVHNPYKFWFHLYKENHELDNMMQHIENIYMKLPRHELQMHRSCFKPGQVCCALFMGLWHRAEILETPEENTVKVLFIDYGTVAPVELNEVKFLLTEFSVLPCQALRGCLAHVKPVDHRWSRDATYSFLSMVQNLFLYAKATEVDYKEKVVKMILTDTNNKSDFQINEALIRKGHARFSPPVQTNSSDSQHVAIERRKHFQELYPTFEMLERGEYPSFYEISVLLSKGIDFEALQDENIIPDIDGGRSIEEITRRLTNSKTSKISKSIGNHQNRSIILNENNNIKQSVDFALSTSSDNDISSASSMSDNVNPFLLEVTQNANISIDAHARNVQNQLNSASTQDSMPKIDVPNPFLSDSDFEQDSTNGQYAPSYHHPSEAAQHIQNGYEILSQTYRIIYGYMPPPMPSNEKVNYSPMMNLPHNELIKSEVPTKRLIRPPPGFEHLAPKSRNAFQ